MAETAEARLKRLKMRSWRRGTKEMDLVLGRWADAHLAELTEPELAAFESLLAENDQDLMSWMLGQSSPPAELAPMLDRVTGYARGRVSQR